MEAVFRTDALVWELGVGGRSIRTTAEHPFYVRDRGWTGANRLRVGDRLATEDGLWIALDSVDLSGREFRVHPPHHARGDVARFEPGVDVHHRHARRTRIQHGE